MVQDIYWGDLWEFKTHDFSDEEIAHEYITLPKLTRFSMIIIGIL